MAAPTIPASNSQAVLTVQAGGTIPFAQQWYNFFAALVTGPLGPTPLVGVTDGSNAAAGIVGEYLSSIVPTSPGVSLTNNVAVTVASLTLTAGDWDLWGELAAGASGGTGFDEIRAALWTTAASTAVPAASYPADGASAAALTTLLVSSQQTTPTVTLGPMRVNITSNVTFFLSARNEFNTTMVTGGAIRARRMR